MAMSTDLAPYVEDRIVLPVDRHLAVDAMRQFEALKRDLLTEDDYQAVAGKPKPFIKRSGWRKLAIAFNVSTEVLREKIEYNDEGQPLRAEFVVRAKAPNGRHADGWGACALAEVRFKDARARQKLDHDLPATAQTRATNRACADLFGGGEVSAEEMEEEDAPRRRRGQDERSGTAASAPALTGTPAMTPDPAASGIGPVPRNRNPISTMPEEAETQEARDTALRYAIELKRLQLQGSNRRRALEGKPVFSADDEALASEAQQALAVFADSAYGKDFLELEGEELTDTIAQLVLWIQKAGGKEPI